MEIKFVEPSLVKFSITGILVIVIVLFLFRARSGKISSISLLLRATAAMLMGVALGQPYFESRSQNSKAILLVDISDSNDSAVSEELFSIAKNYINDGIELEIVPFSKVTGESQSNHELFSSYSKLKDVFLKLDIGETDLESAFKAIKDRAPASVILISDGYETTGKIDSHLPVLANSGFKVYPLLPENTESSAKSLKISYLHAPLIAPSEKSVEVRVAISNTTDRTERGLLQVTHDGKVVLNKEVEVNPGQESLYTAESDPSKEGIKEIKADFKPLNRNINSSTASVYLSSREREKVLLVSGSSEDLRFLGPLLQNRSYQLKTITGRTESWPELSEFSVIIFNNIHSNELPRGTHVKIEQYVKNGGSFIMIGGNRSFGLGGYLDSLIEDVLPVSLMPPQSIEKRLNVAVQLLIDKSKSMATGNKIEFAKEAAIGVVENLKDEDFIGVMGFDENPFVVIRLSPVSSVRDDAVRKIGRLFPNFGTSLVGAMDEARRDLTRVKAGRKHMIILTDGQITDAPAHYYYELVKQIRFLGVTVSTVLLGGESDGGMLREMSNLGGGAFYKTNDPRSLPKIFIDDVKIASGEKTMKEETSYQVVVGSGELKSTDIRSYPNLRGYVQTKPKEGSNIELIVRGREKSDPLLASWSYGKGKSLAFTSDANGRWSNEWVPWSRFHEFWSNVIQALRPENIEKESDFPYDMVYYYESGKLHFDLTLFSAAKSGSMSSEITLPNGQKRLVDLTSAVPGSYKGELSQPTAGRYEMRTMLGDIPLTPIAFSLSGELFGEKKGHGYNVSLLKNIATQTKGSVNPTSQDLKLQQYTTTIKHDLTSWLLIVSLILITLEILWREALSYRLLLLFRKIRTA